MRFHVAASDSAALAGLRRGRLRQDIAAESLLFLCSSTLQPLIPQLFPQQVQRLDHWLAWLAEFQIVVPNMTNTIPHRQECSSSLYGIMESRDSFRSSSEKQKTEMAGVSIWSVMVLGIHGIWGSRFYGPGAFRHHISRSFLCLTAQVN